MDTQTLYYVLAGALVLVGLLGVVLPALPGLPLMFAGMWLAAWAGGYAQVGVGTVIMLALLTLLSVGVDMAAALLGARRVGASRLALLGAAIGTVAGLFMGFVGILVGPFVGALAGEWLHGRKLDMAAKVGVGTWLGILFAVVLKLALAFAMIGIFVLAWWL
ncbi:MAG TPA: DUF456 domain-containing protein [Xanthomonadaceae bacterium]|nr:DUF456 domain-containing protein [Xanthomonadaceae bacterium]